MSLRRKSVHPAFKTWFPDASMMSPATSLPTIPCTLLIMPAVILFSMAVATVAYPKDLAVAVRISSPCSIERVYASYPSDPPIRYVEALVNTSFSLFALVSVFSAATKSSAASTALPAFNAASAAAVALTPTFANFAAVPAVVSNPFAHAPRPPVAMVVPTTPST